MKLDKLAKPTSVRLSVRLQKQVDTQANKEKRSRSNMITQILEQHFEGKK